MCVPRGSKFCNRKASQRCAHLLNPSNTTHLHVAANDDVIRRITNDLVLELLPSLETLLNQHLRREGEGLCREVTKFVLVLGESRAESTEREGRTEDDGVANLLGGVERVLDRRDGDRVGGGDTNLC